MAAKEGYTPEGRENGGEVPLIVGEIRRRLGELGIEEYAKLPRKHKKAAKKLVQGKALTQRELARLEALRSQQKGS